MRNVGRRVSCHSYSMELLSIYSELCARVKSASPNSIKCPWYWKVEERETLMSKQVWQYNFLFIGEQHSCHSNSDVIVIHFHFRDMSWHPDTSTEFFFWGKRLIREKNYSIFHPNEYWIWACIYRCIALFYKFHTWK